MSPDEARRLLAVARNLKVRVVLSLSLRERLTTGEVPLRKAYLGSLIDRIEVDDREVRIMGRKDVLERAVLASRQDQAGVHSFVPKWWARQGSNL